MASSILRSSFVKALFPAKDRVSKDFAAANLCLHRIALVGGVMDFDTKSNLKCTDETFLTAVSYCLKDTGFPISKAFKIQVINEDPKFTPWPVSWLKYNRGGTDVAVFCGVDNMFYSKVPGEEERSRQKRGELFLEAVVRNDVKVIFVFGDLETCINTNAFRGEDYVCLAATEEYRNPQDDRRHFRSEFTYGILIQSDYLSEIYPYIDQTSQLGRRMAIAMKGEDPTAPSPRGGA